MLPNELKDYMKVNSNYNLVDGYLRLLNENDIIKYESCLKTWNKWEGGTPFAISVFGEVLVWLDNYVYKYNLPEDTVDVILAGFDFFFENINDPEYQNDFFEISLFQKCKDKIGQLNHDESYTFNPIPALGGDKSIESVDKGKTFEYLNMIILLIS